MENGQYSLSIFSVTVIFDINIFVQQTMTNITFCILPINSYNIEQTQLIWGCSTHSFVNVLIGKTTCFINKSSQTWA